MDGVAGEKLSAFLLRLLPRLSLAGLVFCTLMNMAITVNTTAGSGVRHAVKVPTGLALLLPSRATGSRAGLLRFGPLLPRAYPDE